MRIFEVNELGERVIIHPYSSEWPELFAKLGTSFRKVLGDVAVRIDHIGSTSIPGLAAKPIIDVQISVASLEPLDAFKVPLESLGYVYMSQNPDRMRRYFREPRGTRRTHVHVRRLGGWQEQFVLLFRDYMRVHPEDAYAYAELKYRLAEQYGEDRVGYSESKAPLIWEIIKKADKWSQRVGWEPGPSDA